MQKVWRVLAVASALLFGTGTALADVVTFDALDPASAPFFPFIGNGDTLVEGNFAVGMVSTKDDAQSGDLVGAVIDGSDPNSCLSVVCPTNNSTSYLAALNDGLPYFYRVAGGLFNLNQFDASFIAASGVDVLSTSMLLRVTGFVGSTRMEEDIFLPGPDSGNYEFQTYAMSAAFSGTGFDLVAFFGYACTTPTTCTRALNQAQFGLDNVTFATSSTSVPEPGTWALACLALVGAGLARRGSAARTA